jgi:hypothetical protein
VAPVRADISEECNAYIIVLKRIREPGTLAMFLGNVGSYKSHMEYTSQNTAFFIVTTMKTSNLIQYSIIQLYNIAAEICIQK